MLKLAVIFEHSGRRFTLPQEILEKCLDEKTLDKLKSEALKEIQKIV